ncbi:MAG: glycosyltransferase family 1 protein [Lentisphaerae bacterium]|nr:glycosyltransferase family 1 protein [Lentisphaerota bacterium]
MKLLYIGRNWAGYPPVKQLRERILKRGRFTGQEGFFEASLHAAAEVTVCNLRSLRRRIETVDREFDAVIVNSRCLGKRKGVSEFGISHPSEIDFLSRNPRIPKVLALVDANAARMPADDLLDLFDLVFKREMLKDTDRYELSEENRGKLRATMVTCPLIRLDRRSVRTADVAAFFPAAAPPPPGRDVFFLGAATVPLRTEIVETIRASSLQGLSGLQIKRTEQDTPRSRELAAPPLPRDEYVETIRSSRVNLAVRGFGQFTYRHLELWCLGAFMLSDPGIRDVTLPIAQPVENEHYAVFEGPEDLVDKVRYFLDHEEERLRIARNGRELFLRIYDPSTHGADILREISTAPARLHEA